ncbi:MAG: glycosyltransferase [Candidatus Gastranaerophilales bacterium]|nr:glycosyltransferase [Candidatus Gastranaerophilales bacterium]
MSKKENIKVSVIIPVYNADLYLEEALKSVENQSLKDIEIICINDNSRDKSLKILQEHAKKDKRIKIINLETTNGQSHARNEGIKIAAGEYIGFVDADDFAEENMFDRLYCEAVKSKADIAMCRAKVFDDKVKNYKNDDYFELKCFDENNITRVFTHQDTKSFITQINVSVWNKLYKREFLQNIGAAFKEGFIYEDMPYFFETFTKAKKAVFVEDYLYNYRINNQTSTMTRTDKNVKDRIDMMSYTYDVLKRQTYFKDYKSEFICWIIHDIYYRFLIIDSRYQKEYFFRMQKFFRTIDISNMEESLLKSPYYPHFCEIRTRKYDDVFKYFSNQETIGEAYVKKAREFYSEQYDNLQKKYLQFQELEEENLRKKFDLEALQDRILEDEKAKWAELEKAWEDFKEETRKRQQELNDLQQKILEDEKQRWQEYEAKVNAFEKECISRSAEEEKQIQRQKNLSKLAIEKTKNKLSNQFIQNVEEEKVNLAKKMSEELDENQQYYKDLLENQIKLQEENYRKISENYKKKISETTTNLENTEEEKQEEKGTIMHQPKVSVILPVYNVAPYLRQSLDSVIGQTLSDIEIICIDDGSTDESGKILDEYKEKDERIKVIHKKNGGTGAARNDGLRIATGECIGFVDPDDWILPNMYERLYTLLQEKDLDIVMFTPDVYNDKTKKHEGFLYFQNSNFPDFLDNKIFNKDDISPFSYPMCVWNKLYRKKLFDENNIEFAEGLDFEDHKVIFKSLFTAKRIYFIREKLYVYRHSREGSILSDNDTRMFDHIKIYDIVENILKETGNWEKFHLDFLRYKVHNILYYYTMIKPQYKEEYHNKMVKSLRSTKMSEEEINLLSKDYPDLKPIMEGGILRKIKKAVRKITKKKK